MAEIFHRGLMERSPADRLRMACSMYETAKTLVRLGLGEKAHDPMQVFRRFYAHDFDPETLAAIEAAHRQYASSR